VVHVLIVEGITGVKIAKRSQALATNAGREDTYKNSVKESPHTLRKKTEEITEDLKIVINTLREAVASPCTRIQKLNIRKREW
jgi:hypothetical protein